MVLGKGGGRMVLREVVGFFFKELLAVNVIRIYTLEEEDSRSEGEEEEGSTQNGLCVNALAVNVIRIQNSSIFLK